MMGDTDDVVAACERMLFHRGLVRTPVPEEWLCDARFGALLAAPTDLLLAAGEQRTVFLITAASRITNGRRRGRRNPSSNDASEGAPGTRVFVVSGSADTLCGGDGRLRTEAVAIGDADAGDAAGRGSLRRVPRSGRRV